MRTGSLSLVVRDNEIPSVGRSFRVEASEAEREALAEQLGIAEVTALAAELEVRPQGRDAYAVKGTLSARVVQTDVVTLEPVPQTVEEAVDVTLVPAESVEREEPAHTESDEGDKPDLYQGGCIALGILVAEHLALGLDPYPRAPGVEFTGLIEDDSAAEPSAFAALARLKKDEG